MSDHSAIEWTNVPGHPFEQGFDLRLRPERLGQPQRWWMDNRLRAAGAPLWAGI